jgi:hypothetical protein
MKTIWTVLLALTSLSLASAADFSLDANKIDQVTGLKGKFNAEEAVYKVSSPRADIKISVDNWQMPPFMGLTAWAAFTAGKEKDAMVMGDLVLMQDEVSAVMRAALDNGIQVTALHNHFFFDEPKVYFIHIGGEGPADELYRGVRAALDKVKEIRAATPQPPRSLLANNFPPPAPLTQRLRPDLTVHASVGKLLTDGSIRVGIGECRQPFEIELLPLVTGGFVCTRKLAEDGVQLDRRAHESDRACVAESSVNGSLPAHDGVWVLEGGKGE